MNPRLPSSALPGELPLLYTIATWMLKKRRQAQQHAAFESRRLGQQTRQALINPKTN